VDKGDQLNIDNLFSEEKIWRHLATMNANVTSAIGTDLHYDVVSDPVISQSTVDDVRLTAEWILKKVDLIKNLSLGTHVDLS
jgi:hypothetical protein